MDRRSWSLGTELSFYLVFPVLQSRRATVAALIASLCVFAFATSGKIDPDAFAYRLLPGCLFIFLTGTLIERGDHAMLGKTTAALAAIALVLALTGRIAVGFNRELLLGVAVAVVTISVLTRFAANKLDVLLGDLSYGVYLSHFVVIAVVGHMNWLAGDFAMRCGLVVAASVVAAAVALVLVERPVSNLRKNLRRAKVGVSLPAYGTASS